MLKKLLKLLQQLSEENKKLDRYLMEKPHRFILWILGWFIVGGVVGYITNKRDTNTRNRNMNI